MVAFDGLEVSEKGLFEACGQHRVAVLVALASSDDNLVSRGVDILDIEYRSSRLLLPQPVNCEWPTPGGREE